MEEYRKLLKAIKSSTKISYDFQGYLINYVNGVKNGTRNNDFIDFELMNAIILKFVNGEYDIDSSIDGIYNEKFLNIIDSIKFMLPEGKETPGYDGIKNSLIIGDYEPIKEFYSIFDSRMDYEQIMNIIDSDSELKKLKANILDYAISVSPYCINENILKKEILSYIKDIKNVVGDLETFSRERLIEAKKRCGVYPLDEKSLATISDNARRAEAMIVRLENMQQRLDAYDERVKILTAKGISSINETSNNALNKLETEIEIAKKSIVEKLDEYLLELEQSLKNSSDQIFNSILKDTTESIKNIKIYAQSINNTTTSDLLKIKKAAEESVDSLKNYMQNEPQLRKIIEDAAKSATVKEVLLSRPANGEQVVEVSGVNTSTYPSIIIPGFDKQIIPDNQRVVIPEGQINDKLVRAFDTSIPFDVRFEEIMKEKKRREKNGELFHSIIDEVLVDVIEGDWVYLYGPSGSGKTHMFEQVASLLGIDYAENGPITNVYSVMAYTDPHGRFRATQAFISLLYGKLLSFDELDNGKAETQVAIRVLYDEMKATVDNPNKKRYVTFAETLTVPVNPNFRIIAGGNTNGDGENEIHNAREKMDEAIQQRLTFKNSTYDPRLEERIFGKYTAWYGLFKNFRIACDLSASQAGYPVTPGMITTRDGSCIVKFLNHNSKSADQIIREKFTQKKDDDYLSFISAQIRKMYNIKEECKLTESMIDNNDMDEITLAKNLIYRCNHPRG